MNVIIPMAGSSSRFFEAGYKVTKALLPVGNRKMIEHVVNMFDPNKCRYHIVINSQQLEDHPNLINYLKKIATNIEVVVIEKHDLGPVYSALQVKGIKDNEETIVSYCDFIVHWNYPLFLRKVYGKDGCVVSFKGFHPASFGSTFYAYMKVKDSQMLELREKKSFTENRIEEHASTGIYYFKKYSIFNKYSNKLLEEESVILPEAYVSLLFNNMVEDGLSVVVHEANKFICLGTPDDYEQYQFWWNYFTAEQKPLLNNDNNVKKVGLIPMAGKGSRFREYGYRVAKPLIQINGRPMIFRILNSMPEQDQWIFLPRQKDLDYHPIKQALLSFSKNSIILGVKGYTSGQAATCLLAEDMIDDNSELIIASSDYEHRYNPELWQAIIQNSEIDGAIWTYRSGSMVLKNPEMFAYCQVEKDGISVSRIVEKQTISDNPNFDPLVVGTFWFRHAGDFKLAANNLIDNDIRINDEHYIGTSINYLLKNGKKFVIFDISQWISFGNPLELQILEYWQDFFQKEN
jgi:NDP-sugar pyrophosphorylase family protein